MIMFKSSVLIPLVALSFTFVNPCSQKTADQAAKAPSKGDKVYDVEVAYPKFLSVPRTHEVAGEIEPSELNFITAQFSGTIEQVFANVGDQVAVDDPMVSLSATDLNDQLELKRARLKEANARLVATRTALAETGNPDQPVATDDVVFLDEEPAGDANGEKTFGQADKPSPQTLRDLVSVLEALVDRYNIEIDVLDKKLLDLTQKSPVTGMLFEKYFNEGNAVKEKDKILAIAKTDPMSVAFELPQDVASFVDKSSSVRVSPDDAPDIVGEGTVYFIAPDVDTATKTILVRATVSNPDGRLKGGQRAKVSVASHKMDRVLVLPEKAIVTEGDKHFLFVVYGNQARLTEVQVGRKLDQANIEVQTVNVRVDDPIVVNRPLELKNNSFVKVLQTQPALAPLQTTNP
jgi:multidrug efflux pump subunit AcrA (membrane-fusion protein)